MKLIRSAFLSLGLALLVSPALAADPANPLSGAERVWYAQGLTHPMVVHIPIALLLSGAIAAVLRVVFRSIPISVVYYCLLIGALGSVPSVLAGWAWAPQKAYGGIGDTSDGIFVHRWGAVAVTAVSLLVLVWATHQLRKKVRFERSVAVRDAEGDKVARIERADVVVTVRPPSQFGWQFSVVLLSAAMGWVAHTGGEQVYPQNFDKIVGIATGKILPRHVEKEQEKLAKEQRKNEVLASTSGESVAPTTNPVAATQPTSVTPVLPSGSIDFAKQVWPIFEAKCNYCHGPEKNKGKLRMHTEELALEGGDTGPLYVKGKSEESLLIKFIITDDEDEVMPPPKEQKKVTEEELKILRQWVNEGAVWTSVAPK